MVLFHKLQVVMLPREAFGRVYTGSDRVRWPTFTTLKHQHSTYSRYGSLCTLQPPAASWAFKHPPEQLVALLVRVGLHLHDWTVVLDEFEQLGGVQLRVTVVVRLQKHGKTRTDKPHALVAYKTVEYYQCQMTMFFSWNYNEGSRIKTKTQHQQIHCPP